MPPLPSPIHPATRLEYSLRSEALRTLEMHPRFPAPDRRAQICSGGLCVRPSFAGELALAVRHHAVRYGGAVRRLREEPGLPRTGHDVPNGVEFSNAIIVEAWRRSLGLSEAQSMLVPRRANPRRQEVRPMPCHAGGCAYVYTARAGGLHPPNAEGETNDERPAREEAQAGMLAAGSRLADGDMCGITAGLRRALLMPSPTPSSSTVQRCSRIPGRLVHVSRCLSTHATLSAAINPPWHGAVMPDWRVSGRRSWDIRSSSKLNSARPRGWRLEMEKVEIILL
ncbi:hypothetical protein K466DRAFT_243311 [Polyporus arcularius HHB13444]|uniref:Uncharacterized protein n=1 Tax=Polyporus arcularius HHB13444 TaxID=1314778 RepID=A0A5C3P2L9_9APHY|nr:hypothetical protein K466DRAFT_243311 [Polyporus arcularius HHB13444]